MNQFVKWLLRVWRQRVGQRILPLITTVRVLGLVLAALALWGFYQIADEVLEKETQAFDTQVLLTIAQWHRPWLDRCMVLVTDLGQPTILVIASLLLSGLLLWRQRRSETMALAVAAFGAVLLNTLLKNLFTRDRPELWQHIVDVQFYSFPSGHAMVSMVVFGMIGYLLARQLRRWRSWIAGWTVLLIAAIGFSRLYLGVHWPTDIVAGYAAGFVWLETCILSLEIWKHRHHHRRSHLSTDAPTPVDKSS